ncbi:zinc ribbon domain-containing protein [Clostridium sp. DL1XJH146]
MIKNENFFLNANLLKGIAKLQNTEYTFLSPLAYGHKEKLDNNDMSGLVSAGVLQSNGKISEEFNEIYKILAQAKAYVRLRFFNGIDLLEYTNYFSMNEQKSALIQTKNKGVNISITNIDKITDIITQFSGQSLVKSSDFNEELDKNQAIVLFALIEIYRRNYFNILANGESFENSNGENLKIKEAYSSDIIQLINSKENNFHNVLAYLMNMIEYKDNELDIKAIDNCLHDLEIKKIIEKSNSGYILSENTRILADRMLLIQNVCSLNVGRACIDDTVISLGVIYLQFGINDIISLEVNNGKIVIKSVATIELIESIRYFFKDGNALLDAEKEITSKLTEDNNSDTINFCPFCGNKITEGYNFCGECGKPIVNASKVAKGKCTKCGYVNKSDDSFCIKCGAKID